MSGLRDRLSGVTNWIGAEPLEVVGDDESLVCAWPLNDFGAGAAGALLHNAVNPALTMAVTGSTPAVNISADGPAFETGGTTDHYASASYTWPGSATDSFTFLMTWTPKNVAAARGVFSYSGASAPRSTTPSILLQDNASSLRLYLNDGYRITWGTALAVNTSYRIAIRYDGQADLLTMFVNAISAGTYSNASNNNPLRDRTTIYLNTGFDAAAIGQMGNFLGFVRALSNEEILEDFADPLRWYRTPRRAGFLAPAAAAGLFVHPAGVGGGLVGRRGRLAA